MKLLQHNVGGDATWCDARMLPCTRPRPLSLAVWRRRLHPFSLVLSCAAGWTRRRTLEKEEALDKALATTTTATRAPMKMTTTAATATAQER